MPNCKSYLEKIAKLTSVLDYCSCCRTIHILGRHKLFRSRRHIPEGTETKCKQLDKVQIKKKYSKLNDIEYDNIINLKCRAERLRSWIRAAAPCLNVT